MIGRSNLIRTAGHEDVKTVVITEGNLIKLNNNNMKKETIVYLVCLAVWALCAFQFVRLGFFVPQVCDIDKEFLYCHLHPMGGLAIVGLILFAASFIFVTGVWKFITGDFITDKAFTWSMLGFVVGTLGVGLIFAS